MILKDLHVHTTFSDGKNSPEEMVLAAIEQGMTEIGFSDHSYTFFDESYCVAKERIGEYRACVRALADKYRDRIRVLCGIEQDYYSEEPTDGYDYVIGSVHYLKLGDEYVPVDEKPQYLLEAAERWFGGDMYALAERYFDTVAGVIDRTGAGIVGHIDLITKFIERRELLDVNDERFLAPAQRAVDRLLRSDCVFEINTGAISRGYRTSPYPCEPIRQYIASRGGRFILSSDSHARDTLRFQFDEYSGL